MVNAKSAKPQHWPRRCCCRMRIPWWRTITKSRRGGREKLKKGGSPVFHQDSKTIVADHQQLKSAIRAVAMSSTHSHLIGHQPSWCMPPGIRCNRPHAGKVLYRHLQSRIQPASGFAGTNPSLLPGDDFAPALRRCQSQKPEIRSN